ncbi:MAG: hypothetical protein M9894_05280 [Planctomycetes bacterium]|nr:hypothetical protein [Planctomycetota bacterium]
MTRAALAALLLVGLAALARAQDPAPALKAARDAAHTAWTAAEVAVRGARARAAEARARYQAEVARERDLDQAPWWLPRVLVDARRAAIRAAEHEASAQVVEAEQRLQSAVAWERVARLALLAAAQDWAVHLLEVGGEAAEELRLIQGLAAGVDLRPPDGAPLDVPRLASMSAADLERLALCFEDLAREADRRGQAVARLQARAERLVRSLERRVGQSAAGVEEPLVRERARRDRLVAWREGERRLAAGYRDHVRAVEAAQRRAEARERAAQVSPPERR